MEIYLTDLWHKRFVFSLCHTCTSIWYRFDFEAEEKKVTIFPLCIRFASCYSIWVLILMNLLSQSTCKIVTNGQRWALFFANHLVSWCHAYSIHFRYHFNAFELFKDYQKVLCNYYCCFANGKSNTPRAFRFCCCCCGGWGTF